MKENVYVMENESLRANAYVLMKMDFLH